MNRLVRRGCRLTLVAACAMAYVACSARAPAPHAEVNLVAQPRPGDEVVATVDGRAIFASELRSEMRLSQRSARQTLDDLIAAELLVGVALGRGHASAGAVRDAGRAASVELLLHEGFEGDSSRERIPSRTVEQVYERNRLSFDHPPLAQVWHLLVPVAKDASSADRARARSQAEELARKAVGLTEEQFQALARLPHEGPEWVMQRGPSIGTVPAFERAALALPRPGATSEVVETEFGYHVLYLLEKLPERHVPRAQALEELREGLLARFRSERLIPWTEELKLQHTIEVHPERLESTKETE